MAWSIEFSEAAEEDFASLDKAVQRRVFRYLYERIANAEEARDFGKPLRHELTGLWSYRIGDYRILCRIEAERLTVLIIEIVHRSSAYE